MNNSLRTIRLWLLFFMTALFLSGATAIPVDAELSWLLNRMPAETKIYYWLHKVLMAYREISLNHPFLLYGYDWLAFAHFILAILFIGPYKDPVKNIWVIQFGMIACLLVFPLAFIAGHFRGIPIGWQLIDCSFGLAGLLPLYICYYHARQLEQKIKIQQFNHGNSSKCMVQNQIAG